MPLCGSTSSVADVVGFRQMRHGGPASGWRLGAHPFAGWPADRTVAHQNIWRGVRTCGTRRVSLRCPDAADTALRLHSASSCNDVRDTLRFSNSGDTTRLFWVQLQTIYQRIFGHFNFTHRAVDAGEAFRAALSRLQSRRTGASPGEARPTASGWQLLTDFQQAA